MTERLSKTLSSWLRHSPDAGNIELDSERWATVKSVRAALTQRGLDPAGLEPTVRDNDKQRFELSADGARIRARQGHSVALERERPRADQPEFLYHGTVDRFLEAILAEGLKPMARHHVHLSSDLATAETVGQRRGAPVVLRVAVGTMAHQGAAFFRSDNGVWLIDAVPPAFLERL